MERLIEEASQGEEGCLIKLPEIPGGAKTFEAVAKFCYGVKLELTSANVVYLRCASEHLEMTEDHGEGNLISQTENFLNQVVLENWSDSLQALQTCDDILSHAELLDIPKRCIDSLAVKACSEQNLLGWPMMGPLQSPGGSVLWNGISTGARPKSSTSDWWYDDASNLSFPLYKRLILAMESQGVKEEIIAGSLNSYAKKYLPGLNRRRSTTTTTATSRNHLLPEADQKLLLEEIEHLLPWEKGLVTSKFLFGLLKTARILQANPSCISNLEKRIGLQLDEAVLEDLLMPTFLYSMETLYDVECVSRILDHFLAMDRVSESPGSDSGSFDEGRMISSPSLTPITMVAKLIDGFLAEVASDVNLKLPKFQSLAAAVPEFARPLDDGLYRAIDIYLKV